MNTTPAQHTPTPWATENDVKAGGIVHFAITNRNAGDLWMVCSLTPQILKQAADEANGSLIVRAVNCHEDLINLVRKAIDADDFGPLEWEKWNEDAKALLAKATKGAA